MTLGFKGKLKEHKEKAVLHMNVGLVGTGADTGLYMQAVSTLLI